MTQSGCKFCGAAVSDGNRCADCTGVLADMAEGSAHVNKDVVMAEAMKRRTARIAAQNVSDMGKLTAFRASHSGIPLAAKLLHPPIPGQGSHVHAARHAV